jgi:5-methylcytosine-specific restriction endonuclease McrA
MNEKIIRDKRYKLFYACLDNGLEEPKILIPKLYLSGMSCNAISEYFFTKCSLIISTRNINDYIKKEGIVRTASRAKVNAIKEKRMVYKKKLDSEKYHAKYISSGVRMQILQRDEFKCSLCGNGRHNGSSTEIHHKDRNPKNNDFNNLQTLCYLCHQGTHAIPLTIQ